MHTSRLSGALFALTLLAPLAAGCSGVVVFEGKTPIAVAGDPPPVIKPKPAPVKLPDPPARVKVTAEKIEITEKIQFDLNSPKIKPESDSLLTEIAKVMNDNPQIKKVHIEGHASADGDDNANLQLSDKRAKAVMEWLTTRGKVEKGRLSAEGFGEKKPIADNNTEEGRIINRRVEFRILEQDPNAKPAAKADPAPAATPAPAPAAAPAKPGGPAKLDALKPAVAPKN